MVKNGIRNIHDAIDVVVGRAKNRIGSAESNELTDATRKVDAQFDIPALMAKYQRFFGSDMPIYSSRDDQGEYHVALRELTEPIRSKYAAIRGKVSLLSEDAHVAVVVGDKGEILDDLRTKLIELVGK